MRAGKALCNTGRDSEGILEFEGAYMLDSAVDIELQYDQMINKLVFLEISYRAERFSNDCKLVNDFKKHGFLL